METTTFDKDMTVFCVTAKSFPGGVHEAHQSLHAMFPPSPGRAYFGISYMDGGEILYKAAVSFPDHSQNEKHNLEKFVLRKGKYVARTIENFMDDIPSIGRTFQELLTDARIDPQGYCLEEYFDNNVRCLVKLKDN